MDTAAEADDKRLRVFPLTSGGVRALLLTSDGIAIEAEHLPMEGAPDGSEARAGQSAIVVAHGFTGSLERPAVRRAARHLSSYGGVVTFSFRGHGKSGGHSTVGDLEVLDLDAVLGWARRLGYGRVAAIGFSMGGSVVLRHAGGAVRGGGQPIDAVVAVSSPARWYYRGTAPMRRVHWAITRPAGRLVSRYGLKTRIQAGEWNPVPASPVESVPHIAPTPLLIVHGDQDGYFPLDHPYSLAEAAGLYGAGGAAGGGTAAGAGGADHEAGAAGASGTDRIDRTDRTDGAAAEDGASGVGSAAGAGGAELWIEAGFGHAENAADPALLARIGDWLTEHLAGIPGI